MTKFMKLKGADSLPYDPSSGSSGTSRRNTWSHGSDYMNNWVRTKNIKWFTHIAC